MIKSIQVKGIDECRDIADEDHPYNALVSVYDEDYLSEVYDIHRKMSAQRSCRHFVHAMKDTWEQEFNEGMVVCDETFQKILNGEINDVTPSLKKVKPLIETCRYLATSKDEFDVLVHCHGGISRSTAACILIHYFMGMTEWEAIDAVYDLRACMWPSQLILRIADHVLGTRFHPFIVAWKEKEEKDPFGSFTERFNRVERRSKTKINIKKTTT